MSIATVIIDDEKASQNALKQALGQYEQIEIIGVYSEFGSFLQLLQQKAVQLLVLDIELEQGGGTESGFDIAQYIRKNYPDMLLIFVTGHASYAIDGYDFEPSGFLTKPLNHVKLDRLMEKIIQKCSEQGKKQDAAANTARLMLHCQSGYEIVKVAEILYIERKMRKNYIHLQNGNELICSAYTLKDLLEMLEQYDFFCCHKSFLVSLEHVRAIRDEERQLYCLLLHGTDKKIPLSRTRYEECRKRLEQMGMS